jgi:predicted dehydrogenase
VNAEQSGGGLFVDIGCHTVDILDFLLGRPRRAATRRRRADRRCAGPLTQVSGDAVLHPAADEAVRVETGAAMTFRTGGGALGVAVWDFCSAVYRDELVIHGTRGSLTMSVFGRGGPTLHLPSGHSIEYEGELLRGMASSLARLPRPDSAAVSAPEFPHLPLMEAVAAQLRGAPVPRARVPTSESALRAAQIVDSVLRKFYKTRNDHFWRRPHTWERRANP